MATAQLAACSSDRWLSAWSTLPRYRSCWSSDCGAPPRRSGQCIELDVLADADRGAGCAAGFGVGTGTSAQRTFDHARFSLRTSCARPPWWSASLRCEPSVRARTTTIPTLTPSTLERSVTAGTVSAMPRYLPEVGGVPFIQTDVALNRASDDRQPDRRLRRRVVHLADRDVAMRVATQTACTQCVARWVTRAQGGERHPGDRCSGVRLARGHSTARPDPRDQRVARLQRDRVRDRAFRHPLSVARPRCWCGARVRSATTR